MDHEKYTYFSTNVFILFFIGCYPLHKTTPWWMKKLYFTWKLLLFGVLMSLAICISTDLCREKFDFTQDGQKVGHLGKNYHSTNNQVFKNIVYFRDL